MEDHAGKLTSLYTLFVYMEQHSRTNTQLSIAAEDVTF
jgi:hypothetical protein